MILLVAEKPEAAKDMAQVLLPGTKRSPDGTYRGDELVICACRGHLIEQKKPSEFDEKLKEWKYENLPILPDVIPSKIKKGMEREYEVIRKLLTDNRFAEVICATDPAREGNLIFDEVYAESYSALPVTRMWLKSLTEKGILEAFHNRKPYDQYRALSLSAKTRAYFDWYVGMNACPAASLSAGTTIRIGRVITPTLALVVNRTIEHKNHKPVQYYQISAKFGPGLEGKLLDKESNVANFKDLGDAAKIYDSLFSKRGMVWDAEIKDVYDSPKQLYNLTDIQADAYKILGYPVEITTNLLQKLYQEHKIISYPRTSSRHLETVIEDDLFRFVDALIKIPELEKAVKWVKNRPMPDFGPGVFNDEEVSDHHAIIPTEKQVDINALPTPERALFMLIARRFLAIFLPPAKYERLVVHIIAPEPQGYMFRASARKMVMLGWKSLYKKDLVQIEPEKDLSEDDEELSQDLPSVSPGEILPVTHRQLHTRQTTPVPLYNDASLIREMENVAGPNIGLGTPATRALAIQKLLDYGMITRTGRGKTRSIVATDFGMKLIEALPDDTIKSPLLTAEWENRLQQLEESDNPEYLQAIYREEMSQYIDSLVDNLKNTKPISKSASLRQDPEGEETGELGDCPLCKQGKIEDRKNFYGCTHYKQTGCNMTLPKEMLSKPLTTEIVKQLLSRKITGRLDGFISKRTGKPFSAALKLDEQGKIAFIYN